MEDYEKTYEEFWKGIVENPDGSLDVDQVKRELHDFDMMMREVPKVYCHVTGGLLSKPLTNADAIIEEADAVISRLVQEGVEDELESVKTQVVYAVFDWLDKNSLSLSPISINGKLYTPKKAYEYYLGEMKKDI